MRHLPLSLVLIVVASLLLSGISFAASPTCGIEEKCEKEEKKEDKKDIVQTAVAAGSFKTLAAADAASALRRL